jgi:serine/threonine-protein phosphatase 6 regulatory subunit 3
VPIPSTVGPVVPLTAERLRVCELYGELLHYSNMLLPNRIPHTSPFYDDEGRLVGGLDALGDLAAAMMAEADPEMEQEETEEEEEEDQIEPSPFPVSQQNRRRRSFASDSDSDSMFNQEHEAPSPGEGESGTNNEFTSRGVVASPASSIENMVERLSLVVPGSPGSRHLSLAQFNPGTPPISKMGSTVALPIDPEAITDADDEPLSPGDQLKRRFLDLGILSTLLVCLPGCFTSHSEHLLQDLVFQFPWNNFLHSVVYDILHQVLFGKVEGTLNRELIISLFRDVKLPQRVLDAQTRNDS